MSRSFSTTLMTAGLVLALGASQVQAHARLVKSDPAANTPISAPKLIHLEFSEAIAKKFSTFKLTDTDGNAVALTSVESKDGKVLEARPNTTLEPGIYTVSWTAASTEDGHRMTGSYSFTVK